VINLLFCGALSIATPNWTQHNVTFQGPTHWTYDAHLLTPTMSPSGLSVLLIGGGIGNDLTWSTPGTIEWNGSTYQMSIDGSPHADAPAIAQALARHGHAVMYYSTIAQEDPKRDRWPLEATPTTPAALLALAKHAAQALASHTTLKGNDLVLVAHSMGAQRACTQAVDDPRVQALVLLGGAQMTRTGPDDPGMNLNRHAATERMLMLDINGDDNVRGDECPSALDFDGDGTLQVWECSADIAMRRRANMQEIKPDKTGIAFGEDALAKRPVPTLAIYGSLDTAQACHAPVLHQLAQDGTLSHVTVQVLPNIGHTLGPVKEDRVGPISTAAIDAIVAFINARSTAP
jgi:hypothetical protein